jgi:hypothetical protein
MLKPGGQLDLTLETLGAKRCGKVGMQHLDGDGPIVLDVTREIDRGHAPATELALDLVTSGKRFTEFGQDLRHRRGGS